jgi:hypothetical protein
MTKVKIEDIKKLAKLIKCNFSLCEFMGQTEKEVLVAQTIHACVKNYKKYNKIFSFLGNLKESAMFQNSSAYKWLVENDYFKEGVYENKKVIYPTQKLIHELNNFFGIN